MSEQQSTPPFAKVKVNAEAHTNSTAVVKTPGSKKTKQVAAQLADEIHGMFVSAYAIGESIDHEWLTNTISRELEFVEGRTMKEARLQAFTEAVQIITPATSVLLAIGLLNNKISANSK